MSAHCIVPATFLDFEIFLQVGEKSEEGVFDSQTTKGTCEGTLRCIKMSGALFPNMNNHENIMESLKKPEFPSSPLRIPDLGLIWDALGNTF